MSYADIVPAGIVPAAVLETILSRLGVLFLIGTAGDTIAAREAAASMLASYDPRTEEELCLAANIIAFSFQALAALGQACDPEMSLTRVLRLRSGAVSLGREAEKSRRRLAQLRKPQPHAEPKHEPAPIDATSPAKAAPVAKKLTWTQLNAQRQRDRALAARAKKAEARAAAAQATARPAPEMMPRAL